MFITKFSTENLTFTRTKSLVRTDYFVH